MGNSLIIILLVGLPLLGGMVYLLAVIVRALRKHINHCRNKKVDI